MAVALALSTPVEAAPLAGPGFRGASRLAASSATMMGDALRTNQENVVSSLASFRRQLEHLEAILQDPAAPSLPQVLESGAAARRRLLEGSPIEAAHEPDRLPG
jgi:prephenate dehydrogenase